MRLGVAFHLAVVVCAGAVARAAPPAPPRQPTPAQKAELKSVYPGIAAMAERVRKPRGIMAELAHAYGFNEEDL